MTGQSQWQFRIYNIKSYISEPRVGFQVYSSFFHSVWGLYSGGLLRLKRGKIYILFTPTILSPSVTWKLKFVILPEGRRRAWEVKEYRKVFPWQWLYPFRISSEAPKLLIYPSKFFWRGWLHSILMAIHFLISGTTR